MSGVELLLDRALYHARGGQPDPLYCLVLAAQDLAYDKEPPQGAARAMIVLNAAAGGSLVQWYESRRHTLRAKKWAETVALLEDTLFNVQTGVFT